METQAWHPTANDLKNLCELSTENLKIRAALGDTGSWILVIDGEKDEAETA